MKRTIARIACSLQIFAEDAQGRSQDRWQRVVSAIQACTETCSFGRSWTASGAHLMNVLLSGHRACQKVSKLKTGTNEDNDQYIQDMDEVVMLDNDRKLLPK